MPDFRDQYKEKPFGFRGVEESRMVRMERCVGTRKNRRSKDFNKNRDITHPTSSTSQRQVARNEESIVKEDRATRFKKWKAEKDRQRAMEKTKKKLPFAVGVVHHKIYSPAAGELKNTIASSSNPKVHVNAEPKPSTGKKISKVTEKRLKAKAMKEKLEPSKKILSSSMKPVEKAPQIKESLAPTDYKFAAPAGLVEMPLFGKSIITPTAEQIMEFALSPPKRRSLGKGVSTTAFIVESIYSHESVGLENTGHLSVENSMNQEDSVETITLRLSSDSFASQNSPLSKQQSPHTSLEFNTSSSKNRRSSSSDSKWNRSIEEVKAENPNISLNVSKKRVYNSTMEKDVLDNTNSTLLNTTFEYEPIEPLNKSESSKSEAILNSSENAKTPTENSRTPDTDASAHSKMSSSSSDPAILSPYIVSSRGKSKARKEEQLRRGLGKLPGDGIPTKYTVMQECLNMSIEDEERTAQYFYFLLNKETERLKEFCRQWEAIKVEPGVAEDAQYLINQAIGQTNLLLNKKFERFRGLVRDCETGKGEMLVTCKDLQGFWDMMYREVTDCDIRFQKLEKSRTENWAEEKPEIIQPVPRKKAGGKKKAIAAKPSGIRALIIAGRREKLLSNSESNTDKSDSTKSEDSPALSSDSSYKPESSAVKDNTRKSIAAPGDGVKHTPGKRESTRMSLLQKVQLSETSRKIRSPLAAMKISRMYKTPDPKSKEVKRCPTIEQTPGKSILKKPGETRDLNSSVKSTHKVNFDDNITLNEIPVAEEVRVKLDLASALGRIDSFDFDTSREQVELAVERKLNFDSDSSDESENILDKLEKQDLRMKKESALYDKSAIAPLLTFTDATPMKETQETKPTPRKSLRRRSTAPSILRHSTRSPLRTMESPENRDPIDSTRQGQISRQDTMHTVEEDTDHEDEHNESIRILRNRTVSILEPPRTPKTPRKAPVTTPRSKQKENATPSRRTRKSSSKVTIEDEPQSLTDLEGTMDVISLNENTLNEDTNKPKRSSKFRLKYSETECSDLLDQTAASPETPRVKGRKLGSSERKRRSRPSKNTTSFDTPEKLPMRIRRTRSEKF